MIQRIQTVYLFALFAIGLILIWQDPVYAYFDAANEQGSCVLMFWNSYIGTSPGKPVIYIPDMMTILIFIAAMAVGVISIFFYKNRKFQLRMVLSSLMLCVLLECVLLARYYIFQAGHDDFSGHLGIPLIWPVLMSISAVMAYRGIKADEEMVRSMDRIR
ncbi:MAG: DUF4293 domain-containing protein [Bacteroidota bacterium]